MEFPNKKNQSKHLIIKEIEPYSNLFVHLLNKTNANMKQYINKLLFFSILGVIAGCLISATLFKDEKNEPGYTESWKKIDSLESKGLFRMALEEVHEIFDKATTAGHHNQVIKSVLFELKYNSYLEEDDYVLGIYKLEELIDEVPSPSKEIFHSLLAEVYWGYYSSNTWKFSQRTNVVDVDLQDVRTWDLKRIAVKIRWHYQQSLRNPKISQSAKIESFNEIISPGSDNNSIRPTLYDFLGHRALDFFKTSTFEVPGPAETFTLDDEEYFLSNTSFLNLNRTTQDSLNTRFLALQVFHLLTTFHQKQENTKPLFHLELERLKFAQSYSTLSEKDDLYYKGLERLTEAYKAHDFASEAWYEIAVFHSNKGNTYNHLADTTIRWEKKKAWSICEKTIKNYPNTHGSRQCKSLRSNLLAKDLRLTGEDALPTETNARILLNYKNIDKVFIKIIPFDHKKLSSNRYHGDKFYKDLKKNKGVYRDSIALTDPLDYNEHTSELLIPELESGFYYVVVSSGDSFDNEKEGLAFLPLWITDITYQHRKTAGYNHILVSDRTSGKPLKNASVTVEYSKYSYALSRYEYKNVGTFKTDANGQCKFKAKNDYYDYRLVLKHNGQTYIPNTSFNGHYYDNTNTGRTVTSIFTDRKIYRPGQKIYFKGIMINYKGKERELVKDYSTSVSFYDVNHQLIESVQVKTNQFGSFEGSFTAPFGVLTGQMRITAGYGNSYIRVEEYKRPKFNVEMEPVEGEFQVNDSISVSGFAQAFAGNRLDGADVKYRVVRSTRYNHWYWWYWYPQAEPREITNGSLITDDNGEFDVVFKALPDKESDPKNLPLFNYTIYVDVTDINGETHSASTTITAGYQSLQLGNNFQDDMNNTEDFVLKVSTSNLNGQPVHAAGEINIERLKTPKQTYHARKWEQPDMPLWNEDEFHKLFPNSEYERESEWQNWESEKVVFTQSFDTRITDSVTIDNYKKWQPGVYKYVSKAKDKNGIEVVDIRYFTVFNPESSKTPSNSAFWVRSLNKVAEPGETVRILLASQEKDLLVHYDLEANGKIVSTDEIVLNNEQKTIDFKVLEAWRGNFTVHFSAIKNNRYFGQSVITVVPYTNKQLDLSFETFRNKLLPGEDEEWTLTINNKKGEKEQAELLATLYDASLDQLYTPNSFFLDIYQTYYGNLGWGGPVGMQSVGGYNINYNWNHILGMPYRYFPRMNHWGWQPYYYPRYYGYYEYAEFEDDADKEVLDAVEISGGRTFGNLRKKGEAKNEAAPMTEGTFTVADEELVDQSNLDNREQNQSGGDEKSKSGEGGLDEVKARSNFNETAFFYPQLTTDEQGKVKIKFTIPESLTKWRFLGLGHTQDLKIGTISEEVVTQKDLMVVPNAPRFLREGDEITISAKISNISKEDLSGEAKLVLSDPFTEEEIGADFKLDKQVMSFETAAGKSALVSWTIKVPYNHSAVKYKIVARAGNFSDGEENVLPVLSNRMMVTESLPLPVRGEETKTFSFDKLKKSKKSGTLKHHRYTLEFTSNPAWYAVQAMPYMMEYPHECAEQTFTRYYSNAIATHVMNSNPKIKKIVEEWGEDSPEAFLSNLQKNQELKAVMLEETPWVLDAKSEENSKRNLAVLLDMERMSRELNKALGKTIKAQTVNGAWPWFPGMPESRYITQHIVTGMGHLDHLGIKDIREDRRVKNMVEKAVGYLDNQIVKDYQYAKRWDENYLENQHIGYYQIQYLYSRSYFPHIGMNKKTKEAVQYYKDQAEKFWLNFNLYGEGMIALAAHRFSESNNSEEGMKTLALDVVKSIKDRSIQNEELGMYWKEYQIGYYWYQAPIETQALMIEMFDEITDDQPVVDELKVWLLKQKQTTNWKTTKQTTEAVYALLLKGTDLLASDELVDITVGGKPIRYEKEPDSEDPYQVKAQAGTGYFKTVWNKEDVKPEMGDITVSKSSKGVAWGAAYWQYFEDLDKITFAETNLKLKKQLFSVEVTNNGEQLHALSDNNVLAIGDKVRVRIELRTDRNLEYVHMKDMRASGFEPINVLSRYYYQDGLGYYQSTKDAATHFFFDYVPKGTYVFEYDLRVQHKGDFSNGITTIQCMYAPEFTSHSEGIRVRVE